MKIDQKQFSKYCFCSLENLLGTYYYIAIFDECVFLLFFIQVDKMSARNKKLEDEVRKDPSTVY